MLINENSDGNEQGSFERKAVENQPSSSFVHPPKEPPPFVIWRFEAKQDLAKNL
jgi:hypothetical protein